jgi:hypothetical protein
VTGGPFILTDFEPGESYTLSTNPNFAFYPGDLPPPDHSATSPDTNTPTNPDYPLIEPIKLASVAISGVSSVVIIVMVIKIIQHRQREFTYFPIEH